MKSLDKEDHYKILFSDNHLLVVNKRANLLTQPNETQEENLEDLLKRWIKEKEQKPGNVFLHCVHRLDKPVSGIVVFAKSSKALSRLNEQIREKVWRRRYVAIVEGKIEKKEQKLVHGLRHASHRADIVPLESQEAKRAELHLSVQQTGIYTTLVRVELLTGRYHQIRAQMSIFGHPVVGDSKYGSKKKWSRILLHQEELELIHPVTKEKMIFHSKAPFSFEEVDASYAKSVHEKR